MPTKSAPAPATNRSVCTALALEQWMKCAEDDLKRSGIFRLLTDNLESLLQESQDDALEMIDTVIAHAFDNLKYRTLFNVASTVVTLLNESTSLTLFQQRDDGSYRLAVLIAIAVQGMNHFDDRELRNNQEAIGFLTDTDFQFARNYNKHFEQAATALFGKAWVTLYAGDFVGASSLLAVLLSERAPLVFCEQRNVVVTMPSEFSLIK